MAVIDALHHPVIRTTGRWIRKEVVRGIDERVPTVEWHWEVQLDGPEPLRAMFLLQVGEQISWGRSLGEPRTRVRGRLHFFPMDWFQSDDVQINFESNRLVVVPSKALKEDPRDVVETSVPIEIQGGTFVSFAELPIQPPVRAIVLPVAASDTAETWLGKWRLTQTVRDALPPELEFLGTGQQSGNDEVHQSLFEI